MSAPTFMIIPSLACQASCKYCFGPHEGAVMDEHTARETVRFVQSIAMGELEETDSRELTLVFHGGEPLLAPMSVWETLFEEISEQLAGYKLRISLQSNLWNLTDDLLRLFAENNVSIGTSIDGPKEITDLNRGKGYYDRTVASIQRAQAAGCSISAIATITKETLAHAHEVVRYFRNNNLPLVLHGAVASMENPASSYALDANDYANMMMRLFPWYIKNRKHLRIDTLDNCVKGVVHGNPHVCTFRDCLGMFLAIAPNGDITSCQRLAGQERFKMGSVFDSPSLAQLYQSEAAMQQKAREEQAKRECGTCEWWPVCKGGCYYNALVAERGSGCGVEGRPDQKTDCVSGGCMASSPGSSAVDPLCEGYKRIFSFVKEQVKKEMQSPENLKAVAAQPARPDENPFLRRGAYISLAADMHPTRIADNARQILAIFELSKTDDPHLAAERLFKQKICGDIDVTAKLLKEMQSNLHTGARRLNNCYLHVTSNCNLRCSHCYASAGERAEEIAPEDIDRLTSEALRAGFRQIVITGGEPLMHARRSDLLAICHCHKGQGTNLVLRTNLTGDFVAEDFAALARSFDQVVVSVDGSEETHDARRGKGTYKKVVHSLETYLQVAATVRDAAELSLACVLCADEVKGKPGRSVQQLGNRLGVRRIRFRPLLPLGRAALLDEPVMCEGLIQQTTPEDVLLTPFRPLTTCGIGQNLFISPDGRAYPCYAWCQDYTCMGNAFTEGLGTVLDSPRFKRLAECTVDTIQRCRACEYRYLCGGACRAWDRQTELELNAAPVDCAHLKTRAQKLIATARDYIIEPDFNDENVRKKKVQT